MPDTCTQLRLVSKLIMGIAGTATDNATLCEPRLRLAQPERRMSSSQGRIDEAKGSLKIKDLKDVGAAGGDRTHDPWLRRPILYPLSYSRNSGNNAELFIFAQTECALSVAKENRKPAENRQHE